MNHPEALAAKIRATCSAWGFGVDEITCISIRSDLARFGKVTQTSATTLQVAA